MQQNVAEGAFQIEQVLEDIAEQNFVVNPWIDVVAADWRSFVNTLLLPIIKPHILLETFLLIGQLLEIVQHLFTSVRTVNTQMLQIDVGQRHQHWHSDFQTSFWIEVNITFVTQNILGPPVYDSQELCYHLHARVVSLQQMHQWCATTTDLSDRQTLIDVPW